MLRDALFALDSPEHAPALDALRSRQERKAALRLVDAVLSIDDAAARRRRISELPPPPPGAQPAAQDDILSSLAVAEPQAAARPLERTDAGVDTSGELGVRLDGVQVVDAARVVQGVDAAVQAAREAKSVDPAVHVARAELGRVGDAFEMLRLRRGTEASGSWRFARARLIEAVCFSELAATLHDGIEPARFTVTASAAERAAVLRAGGR